ncbi:MAG: hypothetical protein Q9166_001759 [cf. Caloplaca sp. 2 TL-2023]
MPNALQWRVLSDPKKANPNVVFPGDPGNGWAPLTNVDGYRQELTFALLDENGDRGKGWYTKPACMTAFKTLMYDCQGSNDDTRGGEYSWGHDGVVTYTLDATCVDSPGKKCGSYT